MEEKNHFGHEQLALLDEQLHPQRPRLQSMLNNSPEKFIGAAQTKATVLISLIIGITNLSTVESPEPYKSIFSCGKIVGKIERICSESFIGIFAKCRCILKTRFRVFCDFFVGYLETKWRNSKIYNFVLFKFTQCWIIITWLSLFMVFYELKTLNYCNKSCKSMLPPLISQFITNDPRVIISTSGIEGFI